MSGVPSCDPSPFISIRVNGPSLSYKKSTRGKKGQMRIAPIKDKPGLTYIYTYVYIVLIS